MKATNKPQTKETFGFKSTAPAPFVMEIKEFENKLVDLVRNIKFGRKPNLFQQKLKQDEKKIKNENRAHIKAYKSTNFYKMDPQKYNELLEREVQKEYKKATPVQIKNVENGQKTIVSKLELEDRVFATTQRQTFATLKDH